MTRRAPLECGGQTRRCARRGCVAGPARRTPSRGLCGGGIFDRVQGGRILGWAWAHARPPLNVTPKRELPRARTGRGAGRDRSASVKAEARTAGYAPARAGRAAAEDTGVMGALAYLLDDSRD